MGNCRCSCEIPKSKFVWGEAPSSAFKLAKLHQRIMARYLLTQVWRCQTLGYHIRHTKIIVDNTKIMQPSISSKSSEIDYKLEFHKPKALKSP